MIDIYIGFKDLLGKASTRFEGEALQDAEETLEPLSALLAISTWIAENLTTGEDGYYYNKDHIKYAWIGNEEPYHYEWVVPIFEGSSLSPTLTEGVSTPIANAMVDKALEYAFQPPLASIGQEVVRVELEAFEGGKEEWTQSLERVLETSDAKLS